MPNQGVLVKCKNCGKPAPSNEFTLDPVYKMMVCRKCVEERRMKERPMAAVPAAKPAPRPSAARPGLGMPSAKPSASIGSKVRQRCRKCGNVFLYDPEKMYPQNCPQCGTHISTNAQYTFF
jgi:DNA-directed RNA polymerase subunit RPC12/RpoP